MPFLYPEMIIQVMPWLWRKQVRYSMECALANSFPVWWLLKEATTQTEGSCQAVSLQSASLLQDPCKQLLWDVLNIPIMLDCWFAAHILRHTHFCFCQQLDVFPVVLLLSFCNCCLLLVLYNYAVGRRKMKELQAERKIYPLWWEWGSGPSSILTLHIPFQ